MGASPTALGFVDTHNNENTSWTAHSGTGNVNTLHREDLAEGEISMNPIGFIWPTESSAKLPQQLELPLEFS